MNAATVYGARTIRRERRTRAQIEKLDQQIIEVLAEDHPQSVRHVFYRMTNPRLNVGKATAMRAMSRLQEHGFIVQMKRGAFSLKLRHARVEPCERKIGTAVRVPLAVSPRSIPDDIAEALGVDQEAA